jgi:hypothetical protein
MIQSTSALALAAALLSPALAEARTVTLTTDLASYGGNGAYLAVYLTDAAGAFQGTLWLAGGKRKYYKHLSDWFAATGGDGVDGISGASVGSGRSLTVTVDLADALIDAGYQIHIDAAVEDMRDSPSEIVVSLSQAGAGTSVAGRRYIQSFQFDM